MKYFYIDTNQYRHLFSESQGFSDDVHELICKLVDNGQGKLLMPEQTVDEIERNIARAWPDKQRKLADAEIKKLKDKIKYLQDNYSEYESNIEIIKQIESHISKVRDDSKVIIKTYTNSKSTQNKKLQDLFERAEIIEETDEIYINAERRFRKGNPPYDDKIGDHLIWESVVSRLSGESKPELIFVANDGNAWGKYSPDPWLIKEFHKKTNGNVTFVKALSDIPTLTEEEQAKIRDAEYRAIVENAINDFANSEDYSSAGQNAQRLLNLKERLEAPDYLRIIDAARTNYSIIHSWFTTTPLKQLLEDPKNEGYVLSEVENIDSNIWRLFELRLHTGLKRQTDEIEAALQEFEALADMWAETQSDIERGH